MEFHDKGMADSDLVAALAVEEALLSPKTLARRFRVIPAGQSVTDVRDLPLSAQYLAEVEATGAEPRRISRWFNAASFNATSEQIRRIANLPSVRKVDRIAQFRRTTVPVFPDRELESPESEKNQADDRWNFNYGASLGAAELINLPPIHDTGLTGDGVVVAVLDAGFTLSHDCLQHVPILAQWDFVHNDDSVQWESGDDDSQYHHGSQVLSSIMGFSENNLISPAFGASAILAMTEDTGDETPIEEDNWIAAIEWVESLGADIVTSSLGYYYWYEYSDLDGNTALITRAADMAVGRGMSVFTSAGNERNNAEWPHLTAPADGDSVVTVGAVDISGTVASFSSPGPTFDGRIKPDVCALGVGNRVAAPFDDHMFMAANGTSFATPQVAGVATLLLERIPTLTPMQLRDALREGASQNREPDNDLGWGIIDAVAALSYWGPTIAHQPLPSTENTVGPYEVMATISDRVSLDSNTLFLYWRLDGGPWQQEALTPLQGDQFMGLIPGANMGGIVEYYLEAGDENEFVITMPHRGSTNPWAFNVGVDNTPPTLFHTPLTDQTLGIWPPLLIAESEDEVGIDRVEMEFSINGGMTQGPWLFQEMDEYWELVFPLQSGQLTMGDVISYEVRA
ncbi:MAG: S8 family serine peptidase, partial [Gammaproteobacteria bacterium]|nr:S8 family serine peptidase [Gammaproteobacteria bacterium]